MSGSLPDHGEDGNRHSVHVPVLKAETLDLLDLRPGMVVVDGTVGAGGHALAIAEAIGPDGVVLGLDRDSEILARAREFVCGAQARIELFHLVSSEMEKALSAAGQDGCDAVLLDLGVSSLQLDMPERGFSFMADGPLDMRMDALSGPTAADWLASVPEPDLARILFEYGGERHARRIARAIVEARKRAPILRTSQLAEIVVRAVPPPARRGRIHAATRTFQAVRIAVNDELGELDRTLDAARRCLRPGGRLCAISFHSAEDRKVKRFLKSSMRIVTRKPVTASREEIAANPRARSAKLRCGAKEAVR
ncbi:MAG: 16S rRNA (cytosine(1402)-N(4))-methyltransferase RsmH [Planctomycetota bacterium]